MEENIQDPTKVDWYNPTDAMTEALDRLRPQFDEMVSTILTEAQMVVVSTSPHDRPGWPKLRTNVQLLRTYRREDRIGMADIAVPYGYGLVTVFADQLSPTPEVPENPGTEYRKLHEWYPNDFDPVD
ncbi:hypothetical protein KC887_05095 [Candidatus Kaiserbacteria bacterium]|nr:hypothetical protein [Candidatus Kaiserbacteria bacterium]